MKPFKILVVGINYSPELTGVGKYTGDMCQFLSSLPGMSVRVVTTNPYYPEWKFNKSFGNKYSKMDEDGIKVFRCPIYVPASPSHAKRLIHHFSFFLSSIPALIANLFWKPQLVICVVPSIMSVPVPMLIGFLVRAKLHLHVQDFEVDAMFAMGKRKNSLFQRIALTMESRALKFFDVVSTISESMSDTLAEKGVPRKKIFLLRNWVDTKKYATSEKDIETLKKYGLSKSDFVVLYSGNMGGKQGLELMLEAAEQLMDYPDIKFLLLGEGSAKHKLGKIVKSRGIRNVRMHSLVPEEEFPKLLVSVDMHLVLQKKGIADLVMPSKLGPILSVGAHAIVSSEKDTELESMSLSHPGIFQLIEPESKDELVGSIKKRFQIHHQSSLQGCSDDVHINEVARKFACEHLEKKLVLDNLKMNLNI